VPGALLVSALSVAPTGGGGQVTFSLSSVATCDVTIMNIAGRTVRVLETGAVHLAGANTLLWDGRNNVGASVPSGVYMVRVVAHAEDGGSANALRTLTVAR
jgi:flagellar hook assembly protein FlgD